MRVLILDTGRGIGPDKVALWRAQLGLLPEDEVSLVSWHPPASPLPLAHHLVCGPQLRLGAEVRPWSVRNQQQVPPLRRDSDDVHGEALHGDDLPDPGESGAQPYELGEELSEQGADPGQAAAADEDVDVWDTGVGDLASDRVPVEHADAELLVDGAAADDGRATPLGTDVQQGPSATLDAAPAGPTSTAHLPIHDPRRMRQALLWRTRRLRRRATRLASRQLRRTRAARLKVRDLPSTAVSSTLRLRSDGIAAEFALTTATSTAVGHLFAGSDVVVPVDQRSLRAAWLLARRHDGPDVLATAASAARAIELRRSRR